ncbi:MAG: hypothetical protein BMS9Abin31_0424 [Gammaproteobacteria bacterium]|nr:MAG: hypothetical protein BMS9Abin31_0424 [Gammaproteobacteria bacterium]
MTNLQTDEKSQTSLRFQYIVAAVVVVSVLVFGSILASFYFKSVSEENTALLKLHESITVHVNDLRSAMFKADKSLYVLLSDSEKVQLNKIGSNFSIIGEKLKNISKVDGIKETGLLANVNNLIDAHKKLNAEVIVLLDLRKDINWLYPMLPFINRTLLESNNNFETALGLALKESINSADTKKYGKIYRLLDELRNLWRLKILDFRSAIIRFAGLNSKEISQEVNIEIYHLLVEEKLDELAKMGKKGDLGFETEASLEDMQKNSKQWYKDYQRLLEIRKSNVWRSDILYIRTKIHPLQEKIYDELGLLEKTLNSWSADNTRHVDAAAQKIYIELWFLAGIAVLFVILIYFKLNKSLLLPIENITESISFNTVTSDKIHLPEKSSREINVLVNAFNNMRKQVHHRQMVLEFQAMHDSLTGLPNRALLQDRLEQTIHQAERNNTEMSLLLLDLDRFKDINDTLGHPVGDIVLRKISRRLENCLRATDTVARLGGDEFAIITSYSNQSQVESFIARIVKDIERVITIEDQKLYVGLSVGVASYPKDGENADTLIQHADIAMYSAKRENKNQEFYKTEKDYYSADNLTLLADLKAELKHPTDKIQVYYQPQIDVLSGEITSVESLIRWNHPVQGFLPAEQIIRMAEQTGLISELTYWVLRESLHEYAKWDNDAITLAINLSVWNLQDVELISFVSRLLHETRINPEKITFEITESAVMNDPVRAREVLEHLSDMGIELAIDDYGTGFSSLAYLKLLPVKYLKVDKSFVIDMLDDENDAIIVHSTIDLAHNLGLLVVAEGVESEEVFIKLRELGCDYAQGFYLARPMPAEKIERWLNDYKSADIA